MVINHDKQKEVEFCDIEPGSIFVYCDDLYIKSNKREPIDDYTSGNVCINMSDGDYSIFVDNAKVYKACVTGGVLNYVLIN